MKNGKILTMGIESSCDETAIAVIADGREILSNVISSQIDIHTVYGGVVPEIASRHHLSNIPYVFDQALLEAKVSLDEIDEIGVTAGPGLPGAVLMGTAYAKAVSLAAGKPLIGVHHIQGHIMANLIEHPEIQPPFLALVISGGHTHFIKVNGWDEFEIIGRTRDDAIGEAYDKVARVLGLGYPGGPKIDKIAKQGDPSVVPFKRVFLEKGSLDFSFSGIKTAVINYMHGLEQRGQTANIPDVAASFQEAVVDVLADKTLLAMEKENVPYLVLAGGVACNSRIRERLGSELSKRGKKLFVPSPVLCTDNGVMIASAAYRRARAGHFSGPDLDCFPSLEITQTALLDTRVSGGVSGDGSD